MSQIPTPMKDVKWLSANSNKGFSLLSGMNRNIVPVHVTRMANSISKRGMTRPVVTTTIDFIDGKPTTYIIDAQHGYLACIRLGADIPYISIPIRDYDHLVETIASYNTTSKSWVLADYIQIWKHLKEDFVTLDKLFQTYDVEMVQLANILKEGFCSRAHDPSVSTSLKDGSFVIKDIDTAVVMLNRITDALSCINRLDRWSNKAFIAAFSTYAYHPKYNHEKTIKFIEANKPLFALATQDPEEFYRIFNSIK